MPSDQLLDIQEEVKEVHPNAPPTQEGGPPEHQEGLPSTDGPETPNEQHLPTVGVSILPQLLELTS